MKLGGIGRKFCQVSVPASLIALSLFGGASLAASSSKSAVPICNVLDSGAVGDGKKKDTLAIQTAIDRCPNGGTVILGRQRSYLSGTLRLKSDLTFRVESGSRLLGSRDDQDYPDLMTPTNNSQLKQCRRALLYGEGLSRVVIEGTDKMSSPEMTFASFGIIDGSGNDNTAWTGPEATRPMALFLALSDHIEIRNLRVINSSMWSVVSMENTDVLMDGIRVDSHWGPTRDGIDIVDSSNVIVKNCDINSEDDSICLKSGSQKGLHNVIVRDSVIHNSLVANALKIGTASTGEIEGIQFENIKIENSKQAAIAIESVDGARIHNVRFRSIDFKNSGTAFFLLLGKRVGAAAIGSIDDIHFEKIIGRTNLDWGSVISGTQIGTRIYSITNVQFEEVSISSAASDGHRQNYSAPPEYSGEYPDPRMWPPMPAYGIFIRHVKGLNRATTSFRSYKDEARPAVMMCDVDEK